MSQVRSLNRVILVGRTGKDPIITTIASSGRQLARFTMATNEGYYDKNSNSWKDMPTEWHNIVAWEPLSQKVEKSVAKGDMILVEGRIKSRRWTDKTSGQERVAYEINADTIVVLNKMNRNGQSVAAGGEYSAKPPRSFKEEPFARDAAPGAASPAGDPFAESPDNDGLSYGEGDTEDPF